MKKDKIPQLDFTITSTPVVAHPNRQLKADWTVEPARPLIMISSPEADRALRRALDPMWPLKKLIRRAKKAHKNV